MSGHIFSPDEEILFRTTQNLVSRGKFSVEPIESGFGTKKGKDGKEYPQYGIGQPILAVPFYLFGKGLVGIFKNSFFNIEALQKIDYSTSQIAQSSIASEDFRQRGFLRFGFSLFNSFIAGIIGVLLFIFLKELKFSDTTSIMTTYLYSLATLALPHHRTFFTEPLASALLFSTFLCLFKGFKEPLNSKRRRFFLVLAGISGGYALLTRTDSIVILMGCFFYITLSLLKTQESKVSYKENLKDLLAAIIPIFVFGVIILLLNYLRYGGILRTGYEDQPEGVKFSTPLLAGLYGFLFSVGKGMFFFSPPLILALFGIKRFFKIEKEVVSGISLSIILFLIVMSKWQNWAGGWCWGPRHIFQIHILMAIFIAPTLEVLSEKIKRILFISFFLSGFMVQILGSSVSPIDYYYEFYRTPLEPPTVHSLYAQDELSVMGASYTILINNDKGQPIGRIHPNTLQAPINDSIYIPQNSQWYGYFTMLAMRRHDFFWLKLINNEVLIYMDVSK